MADRIEPSELEGRTILIGVTHLAEDTSYTQEQFSGIATVHDRGDYCLVSIECDDGEVRHYPFDARTLQHADPGEYRLRSTGQIVINPDFLMSWTVTKE